MNYTSQAKVEAYLKRSLDANELVLLDTIISYISSFISDYTGRNYQDLDEYEDVEAASRFYDGNGASELFIDDFTSLEFIKIYQSDNTLNETILNTDTSLYKLYPLNKTIKQSIKLTGGCFMSGDGNIEVKAAFSSGQLPAAIQTIATALVAKFINRTQSTASGFKRESIEGYSYEIITGQDADEETKLLLATLDSYKKFSL